jgi:hypothetical protein
MRKNIMGGEQVAPCMVRIQKHVVAYVTTEKQCVLTYLFAALPNVPSSSRFWVPFFIIADIIIDAEMQYMRLFKSSFKKHKII